MDLKKSSACDRAKEFGIDLSLIDSNLRLSIAERLHKNDMALNTMLKLRSAVRKQNETTH
jgi:hypothetical protein